MKINPTKLLVQDITEAETATKAGILLPTAVLKKNAMKGKVIEIGEGTADIHIVYSIGDTVLYHPNAGSRFTLEETEFRLIDVSEVFLGGAL
jgi:co-chaperonin GroES (HSP10)